jgi:hypothetical protein
MTLPSRPISVALPSSLAWALASCLGATLAHGLIGLAGGANGGDDDYALRAHATVAPVALAALTFACTALLAAILNRRGRALGREPVAEFSRRLGSLNPFPPCAAVAIGSFALLLGMEFTEQLAATGHVEGIADALDGNLALGLALVALAAALITLGGLRSARTLVAAAVAAADAVVTWVTFTTSPLALVPASSVRRVRHRRHASAPAFLAHGSGLRAPPRRSV